jgi:hypothetical protein
MKLSKRRPPLSLCALVVLSLGLLFPTGAAQATAPGTVVAWGCESGTDFGQCAVPAAASTGVTAVSAGYLHSLALRSDGTVVAWGCGDGADFGQCAVPAAASTSVTAISAGNYHSLALKRDSTVVAWGCGQGADFGQCNVPNGLSGVTAIQAGETHSLALKSDGTVVVWGCLDIFEWCNVPGGLEGVTATSANRFHNMALRADGTVVVWGCTGFDVGQCDLPSGLSGLAAVAAGAYHSLALKSDGTVLAWGCGDDLDAGQCSVPSGLSGATAISAADYQSLALKNDGTVVAWGCNSFQFDGGQCNVPSGLAGVTAIDAGTWHNLALVGSGNEPPDCSGVRARPASIWPGMRDRMVVVTLSGAIDLDGDSLSYHIDGVTQDEYVAGVGDDTSPDAALTPTGASSNQVRVRSEANSHFNGRVYRIAYTVSDGRGGSCSGTAGRGGTTTASVSVARKKGTSAIDDGDKVSWDSFAGTPVE